MLLPLLSGARRCEEEAATECGSPGHPSTVQYPCFTLVSSVLAGLARHEPCQPSADVPMREIGGSPDGVLRRLDISGILLYHDIYRFKC